MVTAAKSRCYVVLEPSDQLRRIYFSDEHPFEDDKPVPEDVIKGVKNLIEEKLYLVDPGLLADVRFEVVELPSRRVRPLVLLDRGHGTESGQQEYSRTEDGTGEGKSDNAELRANPAGGDEVNIFDPRNGVGRIVIVLEISDRKNVKPFFDALQKTDLGSDYGSSVDLPIAAMEHWCPKKGTNSLFGDREAANRLIRASSLKIPMDFEPLPVNIVIVDEGLMKERVPAGTILRGWPVAGRQPGQAVSRHGSMVMRNALSFASNVTLYDLPLLPPSISGLGEFLALAQATYEMLYGQIDQMRQKEDASWIIVNAWGVHNRKDDLPLSTGRNYSENPKAPFNLLFGEADARHPDRLRKDIDIVFAAGNCGGFCPSPRCGGADRGPGRSIHGANCHRDVLTVGAARTDGMWLGYSAQGPGQKKLSLAKPDVCASSQFGEVGDFSPNGSNTGTSAACGLAAGVVAAIRNRKAVDDLSPEKLRALLRETAWMPEAGAEAARRFGSGIIDLKKALSKLQPPVIP